LAENSLWQGKTVDVHGTVWKDELADGTAGYHEKVGKELMSEYYDHP
jgi:hypothetical protein